MLTPFAIGRIMTQLPMPPPVVQITEIKKIQSNNASVDRYRLMVSDGNHQSVAMLSASLNPLIVDGVLTQYALVEVREHSVSHVGDRRVIILSSLAVVSSPGGRINTPTNLPQAITQDDVLALMADSGVDAPAMGGAVAAAPAPAVAAAARPASFAASSAAASIVKPAPASIAPPGGGADPRRVTPGVAIATAVPAYGGAGVGGGVGAGAYGAAGRTGMVRTGDLLGGGGGGGSVGAPTVPIAALTPFNNRWTIKARVTVKDTVREWNNARGSGKLFSVNLLDEGGSEIRATFFQAAVDAFYERLAVGSVYLLSNGKVKTCNKAFNNTKHDYEISFDEKAVVTPVDDDARIKLAQYSFTPLNLLADVEANRMVDVLGIASNVGPRTDLMSKAGKALVKRDLTLADPSGHTVVCTLWGEKADQEVEAGSVVAVKGAKVGDFGGRSLSTTSSSLVNVNPADLPDAVKLMQWWRESGHSQSFTSLTERGGGGGGESGPLSIPELRLAVARIREAGAGDGVHVVKATITNIRHDDPAKMWYAACSFQREGRMCNKKMSETSPGTYTCDACGVNPVNFRYILSLTIADHSGSEYVTLFDNEGAQLLGQPAKTLQEWVASDDGRAAFDRTLAAAEHREMLLTVKAKAEERNGETRIKVTAVKLREVDYARENKALLGALKRAASLV